MRKKSSWNLKPVACGILKIGGNDAQRFKGRVAVTDTAHLVWKLGEHTPDFKSL